jgi:hypothetical protein
MIPILFHVLFQTVHVVIISTFFNGRSYISTIARNHWIWCYNDVLAIIATLAFILLCIVIIITSRCM